MNSYLEELEALWAAHLAPREPDAPTFVSLFAGCGGSSLGYSAAGYRELLAVELDPKAAEVFRLNFPGVPVHVGDVRELPVEKAAESAGLSGPGELDLLDGSPPCQGFSLAGKRRFWDPRNELYNEFVRFLEGLEPKAFVMENVPGMAKGKMKAVFVDAMRKLKNAGYKVKCWLLDASWYGVPQRRKRLIWIGVRKGLGPEPSCPHPSFKRPVSVLEAFKNCPLENLPPLKGRYRHLWHLVPPGHSASYVLGPGHGFTECQKLHPGRPAPTLRKTQRRDGFSGLVHWAEPRAITVAEAKRLCSFPDRFWLGEGPYEERVGYLGNAVPR